MLTKVSWLKFLWSPCETDTVTLMFFSGGEGGGGRLSLMTVRIDIRYNYLSIICHYLNVRQLKTEELPIS